MNKATKYTLLTIVVGIFLFATLTKVRECIPQKPPPELTPKQQREIFIRKRIETIDSILADTNKLQYGQ